MKATTTNEAIATKMAQTPGISRLVRRIHMFAGLFLAPWMVMYALSTLVMAHHEYVNSFYASKSPVLTKERELDYSRSFPTNLTRDAIAQQILHDLGIIIWVASGLIMWWRLPRWRTWGAIAVGGGILSFALLVWTL